MENMTLFDLEAQKAGGKTKTRKTKKATNEVAAPKAPATRLMKLVAEKAPSTKNMSKAFTAEEIAEIVERRGNSEMISAEERDAVRRQYRKIKVFVKKLEEDNRSRMIIFPSLTNGTGWYKAIGFSALFYAYRVAERVGRTSKVMNDSDRFAKARYAVSIRDIDALTIQLQQLFPKLTYEISIDGVYFFNLGFELSDDEVGALKRVEEERRQMVHNIMKPKAMEPATYQAILVLVRQLIPKIRKLDKNYSVLVGESMGQAIRQIMVIYFNFSLGLLTRSETGPMLIAEVNRIKAGVAILSEVRAWGFDAAVAIGENLATLQRIVIRDFKLKTKD